MFEKTLSFLSFSVWLPSILKQILGGRRWMKIWSSAKNAWRHRGQRSDDRRHWTPFGWKSLPQSILFRHRTPIRPLPLSAPPVLFMMYYVLHASRWFVRKWCILIFPFFTGHWGLAQHDVLSSRFALDLISGELSQSVSLWNQCYKRPPPMVKMATRVRVMYVCSVVVSSFNFPLYHWNPFKTAKKLARKRWNINEKVRGIQIWIVIF